MNYFLKVSKVQKKKLILALMHVLIYVGLLFGFYPNSTLNLKVIEGIPHVYKTRGRSSSTTVQVNDLVMSCSPDLLGPIRSCPTNFLPLVSAKVTYLHMETVMSVVGVTTETLVLVKLEQNGDVVIYYSPDDIFRKYIINSMYSVLILVCFYFSISKINFFKG